ncbi:MAG: hypothetical protein KC443_24565, partial [Anaerolineales bacterium]|nr:hypothetical protein [Anaerolineales bacterium]
MIWFGSVYSIGIRLSVGDTQYEAQKIDSTLAAALAEAAPTEQLPVIVHLLEQADLSLRDLPEATLARRVAVVERLQETAVSTQSALLQELDALAGNGRVSQIRPFWIVNAIAVHADSIAVQALATRADVAVITLDEAVPLVAPLHPSLPNWAMPAAPTNGETTWG